MSYYDNEYVRHSKLFGRQRPIREVLGGGRVADVLLWENKKVSAALVIGMTLIWFLFEVVEYNFVTFLCHFTITAMLLVFIWVNGATYFHWKQPEIPESLLSKSTFQEFALNIHSKVHKLLPKLIDIACGERLPHFILVIVSLYMLSVIGNYFTFLNFLYFGYLCLQTLPYLYERYEAEVDYNIGILMRQVRNTFDTFDSRVLNKIPRGRAMKNKKVM